MGDINKEEKIGVAQKIILYRNDGNVLALRKSKTHPTKPLWWDLPGGQLEYGEEARESILRELEEETGIEGAAVEPKILDVISAFNEQEEFWVVCGYYSEVSLDTVIELSYEHDKYEWITPDEFLGRQTSWRIKRFIQMLRDRGLV